MVGFFLKFNLNLFLYKLNSLIKLNIKNFLIKIIFFFLINNVGRVFIYVKIFVNFYIFKKFVKIINDYMDFYFILIYKL